MNLQAHNTPVRCWNPALPAFCISSQSWHKAAELVDIAEGAATDLEKAIAYAEWRKALAELGAPDRVKDSRGTVTFERGSRA